MAEETGSKWWIRYVVVPILLLIVGAGVTAWFNSRSQQVPPAIAASSPAPQEALPAAHESEVKSQSPSKPAAVPSAVTGGQKDTSKDANVVENNSVVGNGNVVGNNNQVTLTPPNTPAALTEEVLIQIGKYADGGTAVRQQWIQTKDTDLLVKQRAEWIAVVADYLQKNVRASAAIQFRNVHSQDARCPPSHPIDGCGTYNDIEAKIDFLLALK